MTMFLVRNIIDSYMINLIKVISLTTFSKLYFVD